MSDAPRILAFAGSLRKGSHNRKILLVAADGARAAGGDVTRIDLRDYPLPAYDADLEEEAGLPASATELKALFDGADGLLLACPEYNGGIAGPLKNVLDWVSRPATGERPLQAFRGKVAALCSASTGGLGGVRGLAQMRLVLATVGAVVLPEQVSLARAHEAFDDEGNVLDPGRRKALMELGGALARAARALRTERS